MPRLTNITDQDWTSLSALATQPLPHDETHLRAWVQAAQTTLRAISQIPTYRPDGDLAHARAAQRRLETQLAETQQKLDRSEAELAETQQNLNRSEIGLAETQATLTRATARLLATDPNPGTPSPRPTTVPLPEAFEGDNKKYREFKTKLNNKFRADAPTFRDEQHKLAIAVSVLKGGAADLMQQFILNDRIDLASVGEFWQVLDRAYEDPDRQGTAMRNLQNLRQGKREFAHYLAEFMKYKTDSGWDDVACIEALRKGCSQEIRDVLRNRYEGLPGTFQEVAAMFNRIDVFNRQWQADHTGNRNNTGSARPTPRTITPIIPVSQRTTANPAWTGPAPMDLSSNSQAAARTAARNAKRAKAIAEGLCFTCASPDHGRANCPVQAQYDQARALRAAAALTTTTSTEAGGSTDAAPATEQPAEN